MTHSQRSIEASLRRQRLAEAVKLTHDPARVARENHVSRKLVQESCREFKVDFPRLPYRKAKILVVLARLLTTTKSYTEIGRELNIHCSSVAKIAKNAEAEGIQLPER